MPPSADASVSSTHVSPAVPLPALAAGGAETEASQQTAKRGRRSNPKVKTGCTNCKQRRIKCDELRPACTQCRRGNRTCTGYPPPSRGDRVAIDIRLAPKPLAALQPGLAAKPASSDIIRTPTVLPPRRANRRRRQPLASLRTNMTSASPTVYQPSYGLNLQHRDGLYFDLFRQQTAAELCGYFNSDFWTQRVLQQCHSEVAVRHAVIALGALYKTLEQSCESPSSGEAGSGQMTQMMYHWQIAVKQYSEACNAMLLLTAENLTAHRTRLMICILLACFDSFIGDHKQAIKQIQTGLGLLERLRTYQAQQQAASFTGQLEEDLIVIFTRLAIQAKSYDMAFHFPHPYVIRLAPQGQHRATSLASEGGSPAASIPLSIPYFFGTLVEARLASDKLCETLLLFIERLQMAKKVPGNVLPASWKQYGLNFKSQLDAWSDAFEPIFQSRLNPGASSQERSGIASLKMFQVNTNVLFLMMFCDTEVQFDAFMPHFKSIVDLGWEVVGEDERRAAATRCPDPKSCHHQHNLSKGALRANRFTSHHIKPSFSADLGIVPPLFVVATKCRDRSLRRQAIQLLRSSARREGMWDSELAANIGQWVMDVEETEIPAPGSEYTEDTTSTYRVRKEQSPDEAPLPNEPIPEERRVMVKTVDFDLRARFADLTVGTRALHDGSSDVRFKRTRLVW